MFTKGLIPFSILVFTAAAMAAPAHVKYRCSVRFGGAHETFDVKNAAGENAIEFSGPEVAPHSTYKPGTWDKVSFIDKSGHTRVVADLAKNHEVAVPLEDPQEICSPDGEVVVFWVKPAGPRGEASEGLAHFVSLKTGESVDYSDVANQINEDNFAGWKPHAPHTLQILSGNDILPDGE